MTLFTLMNASRIPDFIVDGRPHQLVGFEYTHFLGSLIQFIYFIANNNSNLMFFGEILCSAVLMTQIDFRLKIWTFLFYCFIVHLLSVL